MKKLYLLVRIALFALILSLGSIAALMVGETKGLALADLSGVPVQAMAGLGKGEVLYAALEGGAQAAGIYRSENNGDTWQLVSSGPGVLVNALVAHPTEQSVLYAGTPGGAVRAANSLWRSADGGRTWNRAFLSLPAGPDGLLPGVNALAVDPRQPDALYVGTAGHGVYRFESGGYELIGGLSLYNAHVNRLLVGPQGRVYALTNEGLFVTDGGIWQSLTTPELVASLAVAPDDPQRLYAGGVSTGIFRSSDSGQTWERMRSGMDLVPGAALRVTALAVDETDSRHLAAAAAYGVGNRFAPGGVYESKDGGYSWTKLADASSLVRQLTLNQGGIYAVTESGLVHYGKPAVPGPGAVSSSLRAGLGVSGSGALLSGLAEPSGVQVLILVLTVALAALALVGRTEWVLHKKISSQSQ